MLQHLDYLNQNIMLLEHSNKVDFLYSDFSYVVYLNAFFSEAIYFRSIPTIKYYHT